jgi:hypothetical protein
MRHALAAALLAALPATAVRAQDVYLCAPDAAAGLVYSESANRWNPTTFNHDDRRYLLRRARAGEGTGGPAFAWAVYRVGREAPEATCAEDFAASGTIACRWMLEFRFSRATLRYQIVRAEGSVEPPAREGGADPLYIEVGRCAPR